MKKEVLNKLNPFKKFKTKRKNSILSIFLEKNCLFFHIPKTAGISVSKSLFGDV